MVLLVFVCFVVLLEFCHTRLVVNAGQVGEDAETGKHRRILLLDH